MPITNADKNDKNANMHPKPVNAGYNTPVFRGTNHQYRKPMQQTPIPTAITPKLVTKDRHHSPYPSNASIRVKIVPVKIPSKMNPKAKPANIRLGMSTYAFFTSSPALIWPIFAMLSHLFIKLFLLISYSVLRGIQPDILILGKKSGLPSVLIRRYLQTPMYTHG